MGGLLRDQVRDVILVAVIGGLVHAYLVRRTP
jgi:hypothetical protein